MSAYSAAADALERALLRDGFDPDDPLGTGFLLR